MTKAKAEAGDAVAAAAAGLMPAGVAWDHDDHDGWRIAAAAAVSYCCCQSRHVIHLTRAAMRDEFVDAIQSVACLRRDVQSVCAGVCGLCLCLAWLWVVLLGAHLHFAGHLGWAA